MQSRYAFLFSFFLSAPAFADIVFINLHDSPGEEQAARDAADQRHEKLWVVKSTDFDAPYHATLNTQMDALAPKIKSSIQELNDIDDSIQNEKDAYSIAKNSRNMTWLGKKIEAFTGDAAKEMKTHEDAVQALEKKKIALQQKQKVLQNQYIALEKQNNSVSKELETTLQQIQNSGKSISSLIVSGHHVGNQYWGDHDRKVIERDLSATLKKYPKVTNTLQALYEWGCHTGEADKITEWKTAFPSLKLVLGFLGTGPIENSMADNTILRDALTREADLLRTNDLKQAQKMLNGLKNAAVTYLAGALNQCYVGTAITGLKANKINDALNVNCADPVLKRKLLESFSHYQKYKAAQENTFTDVPGMDANPDKNSIKSFYNDEEQFKNCYRSYSIAIPSPDDIVNLIHFKNIQANFQAFYGGKLGSTRHDVLQAVKTISDPTIKSAAQKILGDLKCVPESWITEVAKTGTKPAPPDFNRCQ